MLKEHSYLVKQTVALLDVVLLAGAYILAYGVVATYQDLEPIGYYWYMLVGFMGFYLYFAWTRQLFSILQFSWVKGVLRRIIMIFISAEILGAAVLYFAPAHFLNRWLYLLFGLFSFIFITTEKLILRSFFLHTRRSNRHTVPILLFGRGRQASQIIREIARQPESGLRIVRKVDLSVSPAEFSDILSHLFVEEIFFIIPRSLTSNGFHIDPYLQVCEQMGRTARVFINLSNATHFARWKFHSFMDNPTLISYTAELDPDQLIFKRTFDICGALCGTIILVLLYPFIAALIKLTSRGPVMYKQIRVGKDGKRFILYKFRSMYVGAEKHKKELQKDNELDGVMFKIRNDPRATLVGRVLRRLSLDELPQFINVLKGEMSLVGTRPPLPEEIGQYSQWHFRRICVRPGMTGLWQVSGRSRITSFDDIVKLDLKYIDTWSLWLDIAIILRTFVALFRRNEAS
jgi:exopolysaccharide biosynthesis polyprenyl glycosylphosphotransferase